MPASQEHISGATPMGATLVDGGATFRVWAPRTRSVHVTFVGVEGYAHTPDTALVENSHSHHWTGFFPDVTDGTRYRFWIVGEGSAGFKRDPWARELEFGDFKEPDCIVRERDSYPWHDERFVAPAFNDLIVYQFHVGVFFAIDDAGRDRRPGRVAKFLDALDRVDYLADLGVNAVQPLPFVEFRTSSSQGYNGTDIFSPEMDYCVQPEELAPYLARVNGLLAKKGRAPLMAAHLTGQVNQLKAFIDVCHLYGIAVLADVVYNHAGGELDDQSLDFFNRPANPDDTNSIYFSTGREAGGKVFQYAEPEIREFLIGNARMFLHEYHVDGFRFDQVTVIDRNGGWYFCQDLTNTLHYLKPSAALIAEYWGEYRWKAILSPLDNAGMGFDLGYADGLRDSVREVLRQTAGGGDASVDIGSLQAGLYRPVNVPEAWRAYNCIENHDLLLDADGDHRYPRIPQRADWDNTRSWLARSRSRVATGVLLTAPGVPMLFMGQEFLEDKWWSDDPHRADRFISWAGLEGSDHHMGDFHRFTRDLIWLRRRHPALRSEPVNVYHIDNVNRVLAYHRWLSDVGRDVVMIVSLREQTFSDHSYALGFPLPGHWHEVFNSDVYDHFVNPWVQGNPGGVDADGGPMHGMDQSACITIPANSVIVFARDHGD
jgi:1,4-alpha-glucan branching enzyme